MRSRRANRPMKSRDRYHVGFNLDLPFSWSGQFYYSHSYETNFYLHHEVNPNAINVALGNTVGGVTKPASPSLSESVLRSDRVSVQFARNARLYPCASACWATFTRSRKKARGLTGRCLICRAARSKRPLAVFMNRTMWLRTRQQCRLAAPGRDDAAFPQST